MLNALNRLKTIFAPERKTPAPSPEPQATPLTPGRLHFTQERFDAYKAHVLAAARAARVVEKPFYHMYIEKIFPDELYEAVNKRISVYEDKKKLGQRKQDNPEHVNNRFNLKDSTEPEITYIKRLFEDKDVKRAFAEKFYMRPDEMLEGLRVHHDEFEVIYIPKGRFQNIHVDIPAKFMSFVFYFPRTEPTQEEADHNGTICYDRDLNPTYGAKYKPNSVGIFVPHFYSYHGFSSTLERRAIIMFYVNDSEFEQWRPIALQSDEPPFNGLKDCIAAKLKKHPLIEYGDDPDRIEREREACLVNAPRGRVVRDHS
ncbi:hypothetical protein [Hyphococcus sp.]|uniref:hypothetical protein n=1 Tax=Hyphococcus sp. TaxID=2038636 RepID=UPI0035C66BD4